MNKCLNCGSDLYGKYCYICGQKVIDPKDRSIWKFLVHFFNEFFNWDSKFWGSVRFVIVRPGFLTKEYLDGRVEKYISPLKLYLCISLVVFLIGKTFDSDVLSSLLEDDSVFRDYILKEVESKSSSLETFSEKFNSEIYDKMPLYTLLMVFLFSLPLKLIYIHKKMFYVEHLVFTLHFYTFVLLSFAVSELFSLIHEDFIYLFVLFIPMAYLFFAMKKVYGQALSITFVESVLLSVYYFGLLMFWFFLAFFVTLWTI